MFLDEIGELPLELQPRLLRVLQTWEVTPVGSTEVHKVDVQVIAATNRDLKARVEAGEFREDLFYRLNTIHLVVPPLRKRTEDIPSFIEHFSAHYAREYGRPQWQPEPHVLAKLVAHPWPGNVRQLAQAIQRIYVFDDRVERVIAELFAASTTPDLQPLDEHPRPSASASTPDGLAVEAADQSPAWMTLQSAENMAAGEPAADEPAVPVYNLVELRRLAVRQAIAATEGHRGRAAELLGVSLNTMTRLVAECCPEHAASRAGRKRSVTTAKPRQADRNSVWPCHAVTGRVSGHGVTSLPRQRAYGCGLLTRQAVLQPAARWTEPGPGGRHRPIRARPTPPAGGSRSR